MIVPDDEGKVIDNVVDHHQFAAGLFLDQIEDRLSPPAAAWQPFEIIRTAVIARGK
jgi:hypothetical protein